MTLVFRGLLILLVGCTESSAGATASKRSWEAHQNLHRSPKPVPTTVSRRRRRSEGIARSAHDRQPKTQSARQGRQALLGEQKDQALRRAPVHTAKATAGKGKSAKAAKSGGHQGASGKTGAGASTPAAAKAPGVRKRMRIDQQEEDEKEQLKKEQEDRMRRHERWYSGHRAVKASQVYWIWPTVFVFSVFGLFVVLFLAFVVTETLRFFRRSMHIDSSDTLFKYLFYRAGLVLQEWQYSTLWMLIGFTFFVLTASILALMCWPRKDYELLENFKPPDLPEATWDAWKWVIAPDAGGAQPTPYGRFVGVLTCLGGLTVFALLISVVSAGFAEWLQGIRDGVGPVIEGGHVLILGWSESATQLIEELAKGRESHKKTSSVVVILTRNRENALNQLSHVLPVKGIHVTVREGSAYRRKHLQLVSAASAEAIIVLGQTHNMKDPELADFHTCAVLRALRDHKWPRSGHVVALCRQNRSLDTVMAAAGPKPQILQPSEIGAQMIRKCITTPAWPLFLNEVFGHGSQALEIMPWNAAPQPFEKMQEQFLGAVPIGVITADGKPILCPNNQYKVRQTDCLLLVQASFDGGGAAKKSHDQTVRRLPTAINTHKHVHVVIVGWNDMGPSVVRELDNHMNGEIHVISRSSTVRRECHLADTDHTYKMRITHYECALALKGTLIKANLTSAAILIFLAEESCNTEEPRLIDEQTTGSVLAAMQVLSGCEAQPHILVEVIDRETEVHLSDAHAQSRIEEGAPGNAQLASRLLSVGMSMSRDAMTNLNQSMGLTTVNSSQLLYRISAMIAGEQRLFPVLTALPDLELEEVPLDGRQSHGSFVDAKSVPIDENQSCVALGWRMKGHWELNPKDKLKKYEWAKGDRLLILRNGPRVKELPSVKELPTR